MAYVDRFHDPADAFNPYDAPQQHQPYNQGGYFYNGHYTDDDNGLTVDRTLERPQSMRSEFEDDTVDVHAAARRTNKTENDQTFRDFRHNTRNKLWTKGGKWRSCGRFCCCTLMIAVFLFVSIVMTIILWVRPPDVVIGNVIPMTQGGSIYQVNANGVNLNLGVNIAVQNPNFFSVGLQTLKVQLFYPINNTPIGNGQENNINIRSNQQTNLTFPFTLVYTTASDPTHVVLQDLATKCSNQQSLTVQYKITLGLRIIIPTISPTISNSFKFVCPLTQADVQHIASALGITLNGL